MSFRFKYLSDPLFLFSVALYSINKSSLLMLGPCGCEICNWYLNDLLLIPVLVPIMLFLSRMFALRKDDSPPTFSEIVVLLTIWSVMFEIVGPFCFGKGTSDPVDVFAYCLGGLTAWMVWHQGKLGWRHAGSRHGLVKSV